MALLSFPVHFIRQSPGSGNIFIVADFGDCDLQVDPVQERPQDQVQVMLGGRGCAFTVLQMVVAVAAGAGVHGCYQEEVSREDRAGGFQDRPYKRTAADNLQNFRGPPFYPNR